MKRTSILGAFVLAAFFAALIHYSGPASAEQIYLGEDAAVPVNSTPQTLPFSQNWTNVGLITANDDWSGVPGIQGFQGNDLTTLTGIDPRTILADGSGTVLDVIANVANCDTNTTGGVAECEAAGGNPVVALQGSGTADVPYIILYLNTTGQNNIRVAYNARDIDGSADNAVQQINTQYRVGNTGNFINVPGGYIADATTGPSLATLSTPVAVTLPPAASNQPLVEVRITTTNAFGSDEWVGIDDISVTAGGDPLHQRAPVDINGDGRTDYVVVRAAGGVGSQLTWLTQFAGGNPFASRDWGISGDEPITGDYDGDGSDDMTVFRPSNGTFYIIQSETLTMRIEQFGQSGDDPTIVGDYDGDGRDDLAVYRPGASSTWFYKTSPSAVFRSVEWGQTGDTPAPGDYDGDGRADFVVRRADGANGRFWQRLSGGSFTTELFGLSGDSVVPGDYDGDGKTDLAVYRNSGGVYVWDFEPSGTAGSTIVSDTWGITGDISAQGDYDGDGRTEYTVWRPGTTGTFYTMTVGTRIITTKSWGQTGDMPVANFNTH